MQLIMYSTGCPRCKVLGMMLDKKGIAYEIDDNIDAMEQLGIESVPVLSIDGELMPYNEAVAWVTNYQEEQREKQ